MLPAAASLFNNHEVMKRSLALCLTVFGIMSALVSCKPAGPTNVAALVTTDGEPAGLIVSYKADIDKASVTQQTYIVDGYEISMVFVSTNNPFDKEAVQEGLSHAVVLLKDGSKAKSDPGKIDLIRTTPDISIRQVRSIKTTNGKKVKAWEKAYTATEAFPVMGGLHK